MKEVLLVRHAKSSWSNPGLSDIDRPLNKRGLRDAPRMAEFLVSLDLTPDYIAASPAKRASDTARFFHEVFEPGVLAFEQYQDLYFGSEQDVIDVLQDLEENILRPAVFFHNPTITYMANLFANYPIDNVPTCGIVHLEADIQSWKELHPSNTFVKNTFFPKLVL